MTYAAELEELSKQAEWWDARDVEIMSCTDIDGAVQDWIENADQTTPRTAVWTRVLTVEGTKQYDFANGEPDRIAEDVVERLAEYMDEEHSNPDGGSSFTPNEETTLMARSFVASMLRNYVAWDCYPVATVTVDVPRWVRECRPEWLSDPAVAEWVNSG